MVQMAISGLKASDGISMAVVNALDALDRDRAVPAGRFNSVLVNLGVNDLR